MVGINSPKSIDSGNETIIDKISKEAQELYFTNDSVIFVEKMISLSILLSTNDPPLTTAIQTIDEKVQDPTYFIATYFDTKDLDQALWVYRIVRLLARYILLFDRYFEIGNNIDALLAKRVRRSINECLLNRHDNHHLSYSLDYSLKQFWTFWKFEQFIKHQIVGGHIFSYNEIRYFNLFKSSDASLIYARVLDAKLPSFSENISLVLHYNQGLLDILDDWEDIEEDVQEDMPNLFVMAALKNIPYSRIKNTRNENIRSILLNEPGSSSASVVRLVSDYQSSIRNIFIPNNLNFLKSLSDHYANTLLEIISSSMNSQ